MEAITYDVNVTFDNGNDEDYYTYGKYGVTTSDIVEFLQNANEHHFIEIKTALPSESVEGEFDNIQFDEE